MSAVARRLVRTRFAALVVCAGGFLLATPAVGLAADWSPATEAVPGSGNATTVSGGLDGSQNLTAIWDDPSVGIQSNIRAASNSSWGTAGTVAAGANATSPDIAVGSGVAVATWIDSGHNADVSVFSASAWGSPSPLSSTVDANSAQAAIVNGQPTAFWIAGNTIESETQSGGLWGSASTPAGATPDGTTISDLRVALDASGNGAASWLSTDGTTFSIESALISGSAWTVAATPLSTTASALSTVSVASNGSLSAIGWSEPLAGVQVAVSTSGSSAFALESSATAAGSDPAVAVDSNGQVFAAWISGSTAQAEIRTGANVWSTPATVASDSPLALNLSADASGDVAATWSTSAGGEMRVYDASPPTVSINAPSSPSSPGLHTWSVNTSDVWSTPPASGTAWTFNDGATPTGISVQDNEVVPGLVTASVIETDGAGNTNTATANITISSVAPTNNSAPTINNGTAPVDGGTNLTVTAGSWSGNPTPTLGEQWQRCAASGSPCVNEAAQSDGSYALTSADVGSRIRVEETATNTTSATVDSAQTRIVGPHATGAPGLSASALVDGGQLTASAPASDWDGVNPSGLNLIYHFQSCNGAICSDVQATGSNTYVLKAADVGLQMQVLVVAKAGPSGGPFSATATSTSSQTAPVSPESLLAPTLSGTPQDTQQLTASSPPASWDGASALDITYQFTRCDANGANCATGVQNTSSSSYTLKPADIGSTIRVTASASKNGSAPTASGPSAVSAVITPFNLGAPGTPTGILKDGATLQASNGTWADQGLLSFQYQWIGCTTAGCQNLGGPSGSSTYNLQPSDVGTAIVVAVSAYATALPGVGLATVTTGATGLIAPLNTGPSAITPPAPPRDGLTFSASIGAWHGATNLSIGYQWKRCDQLGANCQPISGATNQTYQAKAADVGSTLIVDVSASKNGSASTAAPDSSQTDVVAPASTGLPALTGAPQDTQQISAASPVGDWDNVSGLTQTYQFFRCDSTGASCGANPIQSGGSSTYNLTADDIGSTIRVVALAAKNGSVAIASGNSPATAIIAPLLLGAPAVPSGTAKDGSTLTASPGTWADQGRLGFSYQWFQCSPTCTSLGAASATPTYQLKATDVGDTIQVIVTASIGAGAASTTTAQTFAIAPLNTAAAVLSAPTAQDGQLFTASDGGWDNATGLQFSYQWKRCDSTGANCANVAGATSKTYTSVAADVGQTLRATVTASKATSATTPSGDSVQSAIVAPRNTSVPTYTGTPTDGQTLTTTASTQAAWDNPPATLFFSYQWLRCDATGNTCAPISGATSTTYTLTPDDVALASDPTHAREQVRLQVTASTAATGGASTSTNSAATGIIGAIPTQLTQLPQIFGGSYDNVQLSVQPGMYKGTGIVYTNYQWQRCDPPLVNPTCTNVGTAGAKVYAVTSADVGHYVTVSETVTNRLGVVTTSRATFGGQPVLENPFSGDSLPIVTGNYIDGGTLTTTPGTWSPADPSTIFTYEWEACDQIADYPNCNPIEPPATSSNYTLTSADVGRWVVSRVHATYTPSGGVPLSADDWSDIQLATQVAAAPPVNSAAPVVSGTAQQGSTLSASNGSWTGTNTTAVPITYTYQWLSGCDSSGSGCQPIAGATQSTYVPTGQDVGARVAVRVLAKNTGGAADAVSAPTAAVAGLPAASSSGGAVVGSGDPGTGDSTGGGGGVHAQGGTADKTPPKLTLAFLGGGTLSGGTTLTLNATCPKSEKSCKATFKLLATLKKPTGKAVAKPVTIATASATIGSGQKKLLKLKLSAAARAVLKSKRKLTVTLNVSVVDAAGNLTPKQTKGITLRWKKG